MFESNIIHLIGISLVALQSMQSLYSIFIRGKIYNSIYNICINIFFFIFTISFLLNTEQMYLAETILLCMFFILLLIHLINSVDINIMQYIHYEENKVIKIVFLIVIIFMFLVIGINFKKFENKNITFINETSKKEQVRDEIITLNRMERTEMEQNINKLNKNNIFINFTNIIIYYITAIIIMYSIQKHMEVEDVE